MKISSSNFEEGGIIPPPFTKEGANISPHLTWERVPEDAKAYAVVCEDPSAPTPEPWVHWLVYTIPGDEQFLSEGSNGKGTEGRNSWGKTGYDGPFPPRGDGPHRYHFKVFALDSYLDLPPGLDKYQLLEKIEGHIIDYGEVVGLYERN